MVQGSGLLSRGRASGPLVRIQHAPPTHDSVATAVATQRPASAGLQLCKPALADPNDQAHWPSGKAAVCKTADVNQRWFESSMRLQIGHTSTKVCPCD